MSSKLDYITIEGFRSIKKIEKLELRPINVLIGANGSGKSNFIAAFALLHAIRCSKLADYTARQGGADNVLHFGAKSTKNLLFEITFNGASSDHGYRIQLLAGRGDQLMVGKESCFPRHRNAGTYGIAHSLHEAGIGEDRRAAVRAVRDRLDDWRIYHFHDTSDTSPLKQTADIDDNEYLRPDGSNLAAFLYFLAKKHPDSYALIRKTMQRVTPFFDDFKLRPMRLKESKIKLEWNHQSSERYFDVSALSDGTLRFVCLATLFLQPEEFRPSVILVDEPELGLHPYAITMLAAMIKAAAAQTQVIVSTQSPLLLDHFEPEDVLVANRQDGSTGLERLESATLKNWLKDYSLGQLWEKNQFGGRPTRG